MGQGQAASAATVAAMNPQVSQAASVNALYQSAALQAAGLGGGAQLTAGAAGYAGLAGYQALPTSATGNTASIGGLQVATASTASQDASLGQAQAKKRGREDELILVHLIIHLVLSSTVHIPGGAHVPRSHS